MASVLASPFPLAASLIACTCIIYYMCIGIPYDVVAYYTLAGVPNYGIQVPNNLVEAQGQVLDNEASKDYKEAMVNKWKME